MTVFIGRDFSPQQNGESEVIGLDFSNDLDAGETVMSSVWTLQVTAGIDLNPNIHLEGPSMPVTPIGSVLQTGTVQRIGGLLPGVTYATIATVITSLGNTRMLFSHIQGIPVI